MVEKLTVILFIALCFLVGVYLILAPWDILFGNWSENYLLLMITDLTGLEFIRQAVVSNWFRGGITGLGVVNILLGLWEIINFRKSVELLGGQNRKE
ncbi:MAG TPA: hypothetical protein VNK26_05220 [Pyrinomonadaceae bacterium]|jgi:hypothetical protein|nr:hypothetical protein [Pyrinomonadaceae bacterium]